MPYTAVDPIDKQCWIYFYHLDKYVYIPFFPESITDSMTSTFASQNALARTAPVFSYSNSGPRTINFQILLHRDEYEDMNKDNIYRLEAKDSQDAIDTLVRVLQAMALPKYDAKGKGVVPPRVLVTIGKAIQIKGVVRGQVTVGYSKPVDFNATDGQGRYNYITIGFTVEEEDPYDAESVQKYGGFRPNVDPRTAGGEIK